ncbi:MAG: hypothetical protein JNM56_10055 [Planctomycetia bacterium]|nr:hypothetical protein [Planctomycetia bacterium]
MVIDEDLKKKLKAAKMKPHNFALVIVGMQLGLIVLRTKIPGPAIKEKQKELGGTGVVLRGRCFNEDGTLVFETPMRAAGGLNTKLVKHIKAHAGLTLKVEVRQLKEGSDVPEVSDDQAPTEGGAPTDDLAPEDTTPEVEEEAKPNPDEVRYLEQRKQLEPQMLQLFKEKRGDLVKLKTAFDYAQQKAKTQDYAHALPGLDLLEKLIQQAATAAPGETEGQKEADDFPQLWKAAEEAWRDAVDIVDGQVATLQNAMRATGMDELKEVAEFGLSGVTGNFRVPLTAALRNVAAAKGEARKKETAKAHIIVAGFKKHLNSSELVLVCDENPLGVTMTIRKTLGAALDQLEAALEKA